MKTKLKQLFILCAFVAPMVFQSCKKDDDSKDVKSVEYTYSLSFSQDFLDVANINVQYYNEGVLQTETVTNTTWTFSKKTSLSEKFVGYRVFFSAKSGELSKDKYNVNGSEKLEGIITYTDGSNSFFTKGNVFGLTGLEKIAVKDFVNNLSGDIKRLAKLEKDDGVWVFDQEDWGEDE